MKSPHQVRFTSAPKRVTLASGVTKPSSPMASGRATPTDKTPAKIYPPKYRP